MALPTNGRVIIETTAGEIDIELWSKAIMMVLSFIGTGPCIASQKLSYGSEGSYRASWFKRVIGRVQEGAESHSMEVEPFEDEIHPRLRFSHRGIVGMANNGKKNSNDSHPPKIKSIRIVDNPFDDIVPRITAAEKRAQQRAREDAQREREERERLKGAKKNVKLLSFGADEDGVNEEPVTFQKKAIFRPDLEDPGPAVAVPDFVALPTSRTRKPAEDGPVTKSDTPVETPSKKNDELDITKIRQKHAQEQAASKNSRNAEIEKMEADIRRLTKRRDGDDSDDETVKKKPKKSLLQAELDKYSKGRGALKKGKRKDEGDVLAALNSFRGKLKNSGASGPMDVDSDDKEKEDGDEDAGMEVDDDLGFMNHKLHFPKDDGEETRKAERDYEVIDPRMRGAQAKEEERERKRLAKAKGRWGF
ncbi:hypothetical protein H0H81_010312 [Sphagnurus paluster]|uniref:PPIase cyclophilin-type domain-containing protein n=1 Tax=Sphagnurus paluster TaxID=117069 RepID=A0A9P7GI08_9AGAR|nr:hypothetical protein H0H81_010312 [Sphagnurus paluster]